MGMLPGDNSFERSMKPKKEEKFNLVIKPAVPIELRHKIYKLIEEEGYEVHGSGQFTDESLCDISFSKTEEMRDEKVDCLIIGILNSKLADLESALGVCLINDELFTENQINALEFMYDQISRD